MHHINYIEFISWVLDSENEFSLNSGYPFSCLGMLGDNWFVLSFSDDLTLSGPGFLIFNRRLQPIFPLKPEPEHSIIVLGLGSVGLTAPMTARGLVSICSTISYRWHPRLDVQIQSILSSSPTSSMRFEASFLLVLTKSIDTTALANNLGG